MAFYQNKKSEHVNKVITIIYIYVSIIYVCIFFKHCNLGNFSYEYINSTNDVAFCQNKR